MARKHDHGFVAIRIEGGILPPEFLRKLPPTRLHGRRRMTMVFPRA